MENIATVLCCCSTWRQSSAGGKLFNMLTRAICLGRVCAGEGHEFQLWENMWGLWSSKTESLIHKLGDINKNFKLFLVYLWYNQVLINFLTLRFIHQDAFKQQDKLRTSRPVIWIYHDRWCLVPYNKNNRWDDRLSVRQTWLEAGFCYLAILWLLEITPSLWILLCLHQVNVKPSHLLTVGEEMKAFI